jgi:hypothetical protein
MVRRREVEQARAKEPMARRHVIDQRRNGLDAAIHELGEDLRRHRGQEAHPVQRREEDQSQGDQTAMTHVVGREHGRSRRPRIPHPRKVAQIQNGQGEAARERDEGLQRGQNGSARVDSHQHSAAGLCG